MKKIVVIFAALLIGASCWAGIPSKFDKLADKVEKNAEKYTDEQWDKVFDEFQTLYNEYTENYSTMSSEDKNAIANSIGRFIKASTKHGFDKVSVAIGEINDRFGEFLQQASSFFKGLGIGK